MTRDKAHYILEPSGDPVRESRRDIARLVGAALTAGPLLAATAAVAARGFGLSDVADAPAWVFHADVGIVVAIPVMCVTGAVVATRKRARPFGFGMLVGTAVGVVGMVLIVFGAGF